MIDTAGGYRVSHHHFLLDRVSESRYGLGNGPCTFGNVRQYGEIEEHLWHIFCCEESGSVAIHMNESHFRVVFQGLTEEAQLQKLALFFHRELGLSEDQVRGLLISPPRVLWQVSSNKDAELIQGALEKMGCRTYVEPLVSHTSYPFALAEKDHKTIKRELSKVLRVKSNLTLFLVQVDPMDLNGVVPSLMGDVLNRMEAVFRESDTVVGIDDSRSIILGFSTDGRGVKTVHHKVIEALDTILGTEVRTSMGYALFPDEAQSLKGLLDRAEDRRCRHSDRDDGKAPTTGGPLPSHPSVVGSPSGRPAVVDHCILLARGKAFKRLAHMDPETLWLGLHKCSETQQRQFLTRLPFDSPIGPPLEELIDMGREPVQNTRAEQLLEAIVHQIELDSGGKEGAKQRKREILEKLRNAESLPTLPSIAAHIFKIASDSSSSAQDITKVIMNDPPLTSKLLKIVNSAFYGFPQKISTVKQAVVILGTEEIIDLSFGLAAAKAFEVEPIEGLGDPKQLWRHSISTGFIAQDLCKTLQKYQNLGAFTAGLLHDFGKIFLIDNYPETYAKICLESVKNQVSLFEMEHEWLRLTHAFIGQSLASNWNLPQTLTEAIACHHEPFTAGNHSEFAAIVGLADYLYHRSEGATENGGQEPVAPCPLTVGHWRILESIFHHLNDEKLQRMTERAGDVMEESKDLLSLLEA